METSQVSFGNSLWVTVLAVVLEELVFVAAVASGAAAAAAVAVVGAGAVSASFFRQGSP